MKFEIQNYRAKHLILLCETGLADFKCDDFFRYIWDSPQPKDIEANGFVCEQNWKNIITTVIMEFKSTNCESKNRKNVHYVYYTISFHKHPYSSFGEQTKCNVRMDVTFSLFYFRSGSFTEKQQIKQWQVYISTPTIIAAALALNSPVTVNRIKPRDWVKLKMLNVGEDRVMFAHSSLFSAIWRIQNGITSLSYALLCICNFFL